MLRQLSSSLTILFLCSSVAAAPPRGKGGGLSGLGNPGSLNATAAKTAAFELDVVTALNRTRAKGGAAPLTMDERLRAFCRREAELATSSGVDANAGSKRLREQGMAGEAHRIQYGFGTNATVIIAEMAQNAQTKAALMGEYTRLGVGAFWVPLDKPVFQVVVTLARDPDPKAGEPGLSPAQTDPVIREAEPHVRKCYETSLAKRPNLRGEVLFQIVIGATGGVQDAKLRKSLGDETFDSCALDLISRLTFPAPYKGKLVTLNQPMRFDPRHGDTRVGLLTQEQINAGFSIAQADFRACYDQRVAAKPKLAGALELVLTVAADGSVTKTALGADTIHDEELTRCVLNRAQSLHFSRPQFDAAVDIKYSLRFAPAAIAP